MITAMEASSIVTTKTLERLETVSMRRFKNILLFSNAEAREQATLERAVDLAVRNDARLTVMSVLEKVPNQVGGVIKSMTAEKLEELMINDQKKSLGQFIAPYRKKGIGIEIKVVSGVPFYELIRDVVDHGRDLVMKTASGSGGLRESLFGSTALHLMRKCPTPVWVMKSSTTPTYRRLMAAVDPAPDDPVKAELARTILQLASSLARQDGSELHIVHTWKMEGEAVLRGGRVSIQPSEIDKAALEIELAHRKWLDQLVAEVDLEGVRHDTHLLNGAPDRLLPSMAADLKTELIVMGTVGRTGLAGFFIGNNAEKVLHEVDTSVLTVKPRGFLTPVTF
ncbi:universal stress protein, UspA [candidate division GN15 bacterium]|nr:universal stress protein, UspA [candidate division GN15 bacterium]